MYDPIFARSFSPKEQKRFGHCAFLGCMVIALSICTVFKPHFNASLSFLNLQLSTDARLLDRLIVNDTNISHPLGDAVNLQLSTENGPEEMLMMDTNTSQPLENLTLSTDAGLQNMLIVKDRNISKPLEIGTEQTKPICNVLEPLSDYCVIKGHIIINGNSSTIFIAPSHMTINSEEHSSWSIRPYARKGNQGAMNYVKEWTVKFGEKRENTPACTQNHNTPAILFSLGGYSGNHFHAFSDVLIPLYLTSKKFNKEVQFLVSNYKPWWISKFKGIINNLSRHPIIDIDKEKGTHCYKSLIVGLKCHKELGISPTKSEGVSMIDFREFLRRTYSLKRAKAIKMVKGVSEDRKPRLMIISRSRTRILMNEDKVTKMAQKLGYDVVVADADQSTNLSRFADFVNSCDALMGVHGAGLTNMLFLPDNAVVIQVVPFGGIDGFAKRDFGEPAEDMNIRYLEYKIRVKESSLIKQYPPDHAVIRDPISVHKQGWDAIRSIYLDKQNVRLDVRKFRGTLVNALKLLHN